MSGLDWAQAQGLSGTPIGGMLLAERAKHDEVLSAEFSALMQQRAMLEHLEAELNPIGDKVGTVHFVPDIEPVKAELKSLAKELRKATKNYKGFQSRHGRTCEAATPNTTESIFQLGAMVCIEGAVGAGFFLSSDMTTGPVTALTASSLIALTNVSVSCLGGFIARNLNYGSNAMDSEEPPFKKRRKLAGAICSALVLGISYFHVSVGLIRSQETFDIEHSLDAYLNIFTTPDSLFLVMVGGVMTAIAWRKGRTAFSDSYPGYSRRQNAADRIKDKIQTEYDDAVAEIEEDAQDALDDIDEAEEAYNAQFEPYHKAFSDYLDAHRSFEAKVKTTAANFQASIALTHNLHQSGSGNNNPGILGTDTFPAELTSFDSYLPDEPPVMQVASTTTYFAEQRQHIHDAKATALADLAAAYQSAFSI